MAYTNKNYRHFELQCKQRLAYNKVCGHFDDSDKEPLHLINEGIVRTGKTYVIDAIRNYLQAKCQLLAYTVKTSFNVKPSQ